MGFAFPLLPNLVLFRAHLVRPKVRNKKAAPEKRAGLCIIHCGHNVHSCSNEIELFGPIESVKSLVNPGTKCAEILHMLRFFFGFVGAVFVFYRPAVPTDVNCTGIMRV